MRKQYTTTAIPIALVVKTSQQKITYNSIVDQAKELARCAQHDKSSMNAISAALAPLWQSVAAQSNVEKKTQQLGKEELYEYAQEAFQVDKDIHDRLLEEVNEEKVRMSSQYRPRKLK